MEIFFQSIYRFQKRTIQDLLVGLFSNEEAVYLLSRYLLLYNLGQIKYLAFYTPRNPSFVRASLSFPSALSLSALAASKSAIISFNDRCTTASFTSTNCEGLRL